MAAQWEHVVLAAAGQCPGPARPLRRSCRRGPAGPRLPRAQPRVPGVVRPGARPAADARRALGARGRGPCLVVRCRVHHGRALLADPQHRPRPAAGGHRPRRLLGRGRGERLGAAAAADDGQALPGRTGGGAELLAACRVDPVLAGAGRPVGAARREPVAAPGDARAGVGGRRVAGQLRPGGGEHRPGHPDHRAAGRAAGAWRGGRGRRGRGGPARVRAHAAGAARRVM